MKPTPILRLACLLPALLVSGCGTLDGFFERVRAEGPRTTVDEAPLPLAEPINRTWFQLDDPTQSVIGELQVVRVGEGDTFSDLAREYGLGYDELVSANPGVDPWIPEAGTPVLLPTQYVLPAAPRSGIVLNIAAKRLFYFPETKAGEAQPVFTYPIGIGRVGWETPLGSTAVIAKARDPHWWVPASVRKEHREAGDPLPAVVPPGPDNPLGRYVLKLGLPGYLIHGTNQPYGVGMRVSHGCVRLYPENIETLYSLVDNGVEVRIVNQPYLVGRRGDRLYFESHPPLEDHAIDADQHLETLAAGLVNAQLSLLGEAELAGRMRAIASDAKGVPVLVEQRDLDEIYARARLVRNTVEPDPEAPTLSEVREWLDAQPTETGSAAVSN